MPRWRPRRTYKLHPDFQSRFTSPSSPVTRQPEGTLSRELEDRWSMLHRHCADQSSHLRLGRLLTRLNHYDPGVQESALAELELATQLIRTGAGVTFLPESQARTADLECRMGHQRLFVEVTAMVGSAERRRLPLRGIAMDAEQRAEEDRGVILIHRVLARIRQKAKQLADYCDPVLLTISIPRADLRSGRYSRREEIWLDLKTLSGAVTVLLTGLPHISGVLMSLWDVHPLPAKAATRLANVELVERSRHQCAHPRVRLLILNPAASARLSPQQQDALRMII